MKIICAPDSFKESISAHAAANAMANGIRRALGQTVEIDVCPVGDGGEGTMDAVCASLQGEFRNAEVLNPLGQLRSARLFITHATSELRTKLALDSAIVRIGLIELAEASGLALVPKGLRDPTKATSFGTGQLIWAAIDAGCDAIVVFIGGSATVDGGAGIAQALGAKFWGEDDAVIGVPLCGEMLKRISRWQPPFNLVPILIACDVTNPLCGPNGAAVVYGPQKGATPEQVRELDEGLAHLAEIVGGDSNIPGTGAAGGAGYGLKFMCGGSLLCGIDLVLDLIDFERRCTDATLVITGEGRLDKQSLHGKACMGVAKAAAVVGVPTVAIVGTTGPGFQSCIDPHARGSLREVVSLVGQVGVERAMREPAAAIKQAAFVLAQQLQKSN